MNGDPEHETLDELTARIRQAERVANMELDTASAVKAGEPIKASRIGLDFVATVAGCALVGWLIDYTLHTSPWGLLGMLVVGFLAGITNVWRDLGGFSRGARGNGNNEDG